MKVCVTFHNDIFTPWPATSIIHPVETLLEAQHEVTILSWDKGRKEKIREATLPVNRIRVNVPVKGNFSFYRFSKALSAELQKEKPDLIFAFDMEVLRGSFDAAKKLDVPLLFFAREDWPAMVRGNHNFTSFIRSLIFSRMEKTICKKKVEHAYSVNDERGQKYIQWGVPYSTIYTTRGLSELPPPSKKHDRFSVTIAGSLNEINALPTVLKAIKDIDCDFYLIGGSEENVKTVREIVQRSDVSGKVIITGRLDPKDYYEALSKCHVGLTLPFNTELNNYFGITVKTWDYMAMGIPIVASNFPALKEIIANQGIGVVVDPTSSEEIRNAILSLRERTDEIAPVSIQLFREKYCWDKQKLVLKKSHWIFNKNGTPER